MVLKAGLPFQGILQIYSCEFSPIKIPQLIAPAIASSIKPRSNSHSIETVLTPSLLESSQRNPVETTKPRADLRRVSTRRRERRHGCEYHVPTRVNKPIPDSHRLPRLGSNQPAFEAHRFKQLHAKQIRPFVPSVYTG